MPPIAIAEIAATTVVILFANLLFVAVGGAFIYGGIKWMREPKGGIIVSSLGVIAIVAGLVVITARIPTVVTGLYRDFHYIECKYVYDDLSITEEIKHGKEMFCGIYMKEYKIETPFKDR